MGKRVRRHIFSFFITFLVVFFISGNAFASSETGSVNYYSDMMEDEAYSALLKYVFDANPIEGVFDLYNALEIHMSFMPYDEWKKDSFLARGALICAKYANEMDDENLARDFMYMADGKISEMKEKKAPQSALGVLEALSNSFWYLIDGSISKGMKFPGMVDDLYEQYPEDFHVLLLEADRYLHSPGIVGGNKKKGLELYQKAEVIMNEQGAAVWDRFSIYAGLAFGYDARKDKENAKKYAELAASIYTADETVNNLLKKYR